MKKQFFMAMVPPTVTHQEKKTRVVRGKPVVYEPPELKDARDKFMAHLALHRPPEPMNGPIRLMVKWLFPSSNGKHQDGEWKVTKPDTDNLQKLLKDCMTDSGFWPDDALVCSEIIEKFWVVSTPPGIWIHVEELSC